jgi:flavin-dependent dehydrogenase
VAGAIVRGGDRRWNFLALAIQAWRQPVEMIAGIVVAGGGLAGAAAALGLVQCGHSVTLIERETQPVHKICGEFLSAEVLDYLARLGLDAAALGGAPVSRLRLVRGSKTVSTDLPFHAIGLSRFKLDEVLLRHAQRCGVQIRRGHSVRSINTENHVALDVEGIGTVRPDILMLATGKHEVRGVKRDFVARKNLIGFKMYYRLRPYARQTLDQHIELIFFPGGYAGLQMIEHGIANLCLLVERDCYRVCGGNWAKLLEYLQTCSAVLADRLGGAEPVLAQPMTIYQVPYGFIHHPRATDSGSVFRLGDQACVIQSFTGDGMSLALHSAALAVRTIMRGEDGNAYHRLLARDVRGQIKRADMLYTLMNNQIAQSGLFGIAKLWPTGLRVAANVTRVPRNRHIHAQPWQ